MAGRLRELEPCAEAWGVVTAEHDPPQPADGTVVVTVTKRVAGQRVTNQAVLQGTLLGVMRDPKSACDLTVGKLLQGLRDAEARVLEDERNGL